MCNKTTDIFFSLIRLGLGISQSFPFKKQRNDSAAVYS